MSAPNAAVEPVVESHDSRIPRATMLDGIRGIAIVLVLFHHTWLLAPVENLDSRWEQILFSTGNYAVSVFLVVGGFLATSAMLRQQETTGVVRFGVVALRRWMRLAGQVYLLLVMLSLMTSILPGMSTYQNNNMGATVLHVLTFQWPQFAREHPYEARPDLGHLWYVTADLWGIVFVAVLCYLLARWRVGLAAALIGCCVLVAWWRHHVYISEGEWSALIRVSTRIDGILWGALGAVALRWCEPLRGHLQSAGGLLLILMLPTVWLGNSVWDYMNVGGVTFNLLITAWVMVVMLQPQGRVMQAVVGNYVFARLGVLSFGIFVWHYPIWFYIGRQYPEWWWPGSDHGWPWQACVVVGYVAALVAGTYTERWLTPRLQRALTSPKWRGFDRGVLPWLTTQRRLCKRYLVRRGRDIWQRLRHGQRVGFGAPIRHFVDTTAVADKPAEAPGDPLAGANVQA